MLNCVQVSFWPGKENSVLASGRRKNKQTNKKTLVVELQVYLGEKTPSTSVEDTAQYLPYKYTFKDESEGSQQTFVLYRYYWRN